MVTIRCSLLNAFHNYTSNFLSSCACNFCPPPILSRSIFYSLCLLKCFLSFLAVFLHALLSRLLDYELRSLINVHPRKCLLPGKFLTLGNRAPVSVSKEHLQEGAVERFNHAITLWMICSCSRLVDTKFEVFGRGWCSQNCVPDQNVGSLVGCTLQSL